MTIGAKLTLCGKQSKKTMGVYAETNFEITCKNITSAKKVKQELVKMQKESDENGNFNFYELKQSDNLVYGQHSSNRVQNLDWQCGEIWERIKNIKGIIEANFPFLTEADGRCFNNEN